MFSASFARDYARLAVEEGTYLAWKLMSDAVAPRLPDGPARILDLGCGTGLSSKAFTERGCAVVGVDVAPAMLREARRSGLTDVVCHDIEQSLPFADAAFDAVMLVGVMEFVCDPARLMREVQRVMRHGGVCGVTFGGSQNGPGCGGYAYSDSEVESLMRGADLRIEDVLRFVGFRQADLEMRYLGVVARSARDRL
jgi:SAM-dependent methyltransferase